MTATIEIWPETGGTRKLPLDSMNDPPLIGELDRVEIRVTGVQRGDLESLRLQIGSERSNSQPSWFGESMSFGTSREAAEQTPWFESCCGLTEVSLVIEGSAPDGSRDRALGCCKVNVIPRKITVDQYEQMFQQLLTLGTAMVQDLTSRSQRAETSSRAARSGYILSEIRELSACTRKCRVLIHAIEGAPVSDTRTSFARRLVGGGGRVKAGSIRPRSGGSRLIASVETRHLSPRRAEHSVILFLLDLMIKRAANCAEEIDQAIDLLTGDAMQYRAAGLGLRAMSNIDEGLRPKLRALDEARMECDSIVAGIRRLKRSKVFAFAEPRPGDINSTVFSSHPSYSPFREVNRRIMRGTRLPLSAGTGSRIRATSTLYESWCFLQISAAMSSLGWTLLSEGGVLGTSGSRRILGLTRGCYCVHANGRGDFVVLRNEPFIVPEPAAHQAGAAVCVAANRNKLLTPDILVEFYRDQPLVPSALTGITVIDAKYKRLGAKRDPELELEKYLKYHLIRSSSNPKIKAVCVCLLYPVVDRWAIRQFMSGDVQVRWEDIARHRTEIRDDFQLMFAVTPPSNVEEWPQGCVATDDALRFCKGLLGFHGLAHRDVPPKG